MNGIVSTTKNEALATDFLSKSGAHISGSKVKVIMKIKPDRADLQSVRQ